MRPLLVRSKVPTQELSLLDDVELPKKHRFRDLVLRILTVNRRGPGAHVHWPWGKQIETRNKDATNVAPGNTSSKNASNKGITSNKRTLRT